MDKTSENARFLDEQFASFLSLRSSLAGEERDKFREIVRTLSFAMSGGNSCLPLANHHKRIVMKSGLCGERGQPLVIAGDRLYLQRYYRYEKELAVKLRALAAASVVLPVDESLVELLFPEQDEFNWQEKAARMALENNLLMVSGGPGTGKTTTVVKILALLQHASGCRLRMALAAPTGKAAVRLQESAAASLVSLPVSEQVRASIPVSGSTIHRLLGVKRNSPFFYHSGENPLGLDVLVVDEASMVDLALMFKLVDSLAHGSRLILLGDRNQLASVESGTVLSDMIAGLPEQMVELRKTYRFDSSIKAFSENINAGRDRDAWSILENKDIRNISLLTEDVAEYAGNIYSLYMRSAMTAGSVEEYKRLFCMLRSFKVLCALRRGKLGVEGINRAVERVIEGRGFDCSSSEWYHGRPVMLTRNEYELSLYNGDLGICLRDPDRPGVVKVWFEKEGGSLLAMMPERLGGCETVWALTIHKSQGAEIDEVLVVMPDIESPLVSRELLYTGVTRARMSVKIKAGREVFGAAVKGRIRRHSGLAHLLMLESEKRDGHPRKEEN